MRISVIGAYGYTGRLICEELTKRAIHFNAIGRDLNKLLLLRNDFNDDLLPVFQFDIRNSSDVEKVAEISDIIINCAGPFTEESNLLVEKCALEGKIYIDISGEVGFVKQSEEKLNDCANQNGAIIIHGSAFESLLVDLGVQYLFRGASKLQEVQSFYLFNSMVISPGTKMTMKLSKFRALQFIENKHWSQNQPNLKWKVSWNGNEQFHSIIYPLPEIAFMHWNYQVANCCSYLLMDELEAKFFQFEKLQKPVSLSDVDHLRSRKTVGPSESVRKAQKNIIIIRIVDEHGKIDYLSISSSDMYLTTALAVVFTVEKLLTNPTEFKGVISPAIVFKGSETEIFEKLGAKLNELKNIKCEIL